MVTGRLALTAALTVVGVVLVVALAAATVLTASTLLITDDCYGQCHDYACHQDHDPDDSGEHDHDDDDGDGYWDSFCPAIAMIGVLTARASCDGQEFPLSKRCYGLSPIQGSTTARL